MKTHKHLVIPNETYDLVKTFATQYNEPMARVVRVAIEKHVNSITGDETPPHDERERQKWLFEQLKTSLGME
jgi:hypothetical protein